MPVEHVLYIAPGALVDLDSGVQLPVRQLRPYAADLQFDRDGGGFHLLPFVGAQLAGPSAVEPDGEWSPERLRLPRRETTPQTFFVRTERGSVARVTVSIVDPYSTSSAVLQWVVAPPAVAVFLPGPDRLRASWDGADLALSWRGEAARWLVEIETGGVVQKLSAEEPRLRVLGLDPNGVHRVRVRGLHDGGAISLPSGIVQFGPTRPAVRGVVTFPARWYDGAGGLELGDQPAMASEDADVVFYLYGVYVRGGGVQRLGRGEVGVPRVQRTARARLPAELRAPGRRRRPRRAPGGRPPCQALARTIRTE